MHSLTNAWIQKADNILCLKLSMMRKYKVSSLKKIFFQSRCTCPKDVREKAGYRKLKHSSSSIVITMNTPGPVKPTHTAKDWIIFIITQRGNFLKYTIVNNLEKKENENTRCRASLVAQWWKILLAMRGTPVQFLVWGDPTCCKAAKPLCCNYWAHAPQLLKPMHLEPVLCSKRSPCPATKCSFCSLQLKKARVQQWRPTTAKK